MHLWRSLPDGQFLAVLRWLKGRGKPARAVPPAAAAKEVPPATR